MSIKIDNILKHYESKGRVVVKMDRVCGLSQITITKHANGNSVMGLTPGSGLRCVNMADIRATLEANSIYIESWNKPPLLTG